MRALVMHGVRDLRVSEVSPPPVADGELILEVHAAGICGTDASEYEAGPKMFPVSTRSEITGHIGPFIPGHEIGGIVHAIGRGVDGFRCGDVVACGAGADCGQCRWCRSGQTNLCERYWTVGLQRDGGLAQYCSVPAAICINGAESGITADGSALAQPMAVAVHAMRRGNPAPGAHALVVGAGGIGAFLTYALAELGVVVTVVDLLDERLVTARNLGAHIVVQAAVEPKPVVQRLMDLAPRPDIVYEVSGSSAGLELAIAAVNRGGRVVVIGLQQRPFSCDYRAVTLREIDLRGSNAHVLRTDLPEALRLLSLERWRWKTVAPIALPLEQVVDDGLLPMLGGHTARIKTLVDPWISTPRETVY